MQQCDLPNTGGLRAFGFRIGLAAILAGQGMVFGLGYNTALNADEAPAFGSTAYWLIHSGLALSALAVLALLGGPLLSGFLQSCRARRISIEALFILSAGGAWAASLLASFRGEGSVYYEVVAVVVCVYAIGRQIAAVQRGKVGQAAKALRSTFNTAHRLRPDGTTEPVPIDALSLGDRIRVAPGDPITAEGRILAGRSYVRETGLTGEPIPVIRAVGDAVRAGTWALDGQLDIVVTATHREIDRILTWVDQHHATAQSTPSALQAEADRLMAFFVPTVAAVSLLTFAAWTLAAGNPWDALFNAMAVLLIACPCALGIAMPIGIWAGLFHIGQRGVVGRDGRALDALANANAIVFDKTGTLSQLEPVTTVAAWAHHQTPDQQPHCLACVASLAAANPHPVSTALTALSPQRLPVTDCTHFPGLGVAGHVAEHSILLGEPALLAQHQIPIPSHATDAAPNAKRLHVAFDGHWALAIEVSEYFRPEVTAVFEALQSLGLQLTILSGDPAAARMQRPGIAIHAGISAEAKARWVSAQMANGHSLIFVGDGLNDVAALEAANLGLVVDTNVALASEVADGIILGGHLESLPAAIAHARRLLQTLRGNHRFALAYNAFGIALAAAGALHPVVAALLMVGSSLFVSARAVKAARS